MPHPFLVESWFAAFVSVAFLAVKVFCLVDTLVRPAAVFPAADKNTKALWLILLGVAVAVNLVIPGPISLLNLLGVVAAGVYLLDVRPAVRELTRRR